MTTTTTLRSTCLALLAVVAASACGKKDEQPATDTAAAAATTPAPAPAAAAPAAPNDAQIAHIAVTANSIDSAAGAEAKTKAKAAAVKDFGRMMERDHGAVNKQAVALATKLKVTPEDNETSRSLQQGADQAKGNLQGKTGADYDKAYIDHEVEYHQAVLDALDKTLIPNAQNAELKALLTQVRPNVAAHLEKAKQIQGTLQGGAAAPKA